MIDSLLSKLESSRKELLDLGMRNPLLNYRISKARGIHVVDEKPELVFDILVRNNKSTLVLGHSRNPLSIKSLNPVINNDYADIDVRVWEANEIIDNYFNSTYKKTQEIIRKNNHFFKSLKSVKNVLVLGHSMSKVDFPYFKKIIDCIDKEKTRWKISVRNPEDLESRKDSVKDLGINLNLVEFDSIMNFDLRQLSLFELEKL